MRLTKAEFSGFGRLANAQVNLDHKVVAIVGPNEAGKTTLLKALAYIDNGQSLTVMERSRSLPGDIADDHVVVRVQYRLNENDQAATAHLDLQENPTDLWLSRTAGPGDIRTEVIPQPRKNRSTLVSALAALKSAATTAALADLEPHTPDDDEVDEVSDERATFARRLREAIDALNVDDTSTVESQARDLTATEWIEEFDEYSLESDIRTALERVQAWVGRIDPVKQVTDILYNRSPNILLFSDDHRFLAPSYELTDEHVDNPPAALGNISAMAELPLVELWKSINNGDEGEVSPS